MKLLAMIPIREIYKFDGNGDIRLDNADLRPVTVSDFGKYI